MTAQLARHGEPNRPAAHDQRIDSVAHDPSRVQRNIACASMTEVRYPRIVHHLIGIAFSHYVEKARWALDRYEVAYTDSRYLPMLHMPAAAWAARGQGRVDRASSPYSTPILITDDGRRICDSAEIVRYASERWGEGELHYSAESDALEARFHDGLARDTRKIGYWYCLPDPVAMGALFTNVGRGQRIVGRLAMPVARRAMRKALGITEERVGRALERTRGELDTVSGRIADGRPYLLGDRFSAADIAFACALAPALLIQPEEGYSATLPKASQLSEEVRALREEVRGTPAGQLALRLFRSERRSSRSTSPS